MTWCIALAAVAWLGVGLAVGLVLGPAMRSTDDAETLHLILRDGGDGPETVFASRSEAERDRVLEDLRAGDAWLGVTYLDDLIWPGDRSMVDELLPRDPGA
ncbi:hypothetical protein [Miltoncostaea oceani]|uniref:hypothetical protein n=1 Tax=Miltoncostaea oceani TaxID=2843216 RepID=UPI001C3D18C9|nr:hypothetical protein [Miltoncostaea oceani]